jgi:dTDP-glucose 4,6-dehydratase
LKDTERKLGRVLVTGGAGFIGSNFIRLLLASRPDVRITNLDRLTYAGNLENLADVAADSRLTFVRGDIADTVLVDSLLGKGFDAVMNFAAETHVDRSIEDAAPFLRSNVVGTHTLLESARKNRLGLFLQIGTDEVYGSAAPGESFSEDARLDPRSPYSASKAAADHLVNAYVNTYGVPAMIVRCTNNYGPYQFPEKLIPLAISNAMSGSAVPVYGDGMQERDWLFVQDFCRAILDVLERGAVGELYNVSAQNPRPNLDLIRTILSVLGKNESLIRFVVDRPGHDRRYALDSSKLRTNLGWAPKVSFEQGIRKTIEWYANNGEWLDRARSGAYLEYYERHYANREQLLSSLGV